MQCASGFIIGYASKEGEFKKNPKTEVYQFQVGVSKKIKDKTFSNFFTLAAFGSTAKYCAERVKKGSLVICQIELVSQNYQNVKKEWKHSDVHKISQVTVINKDDEPVYIGDESKENYHDRQQETAEYEENGQEPIESSAGDNLPF